MILFFIIWLIGVFYIIIKDIIDNKKEDKKFENADKEIWGDDFE